MMNTLHIRMTVSFQFGQNPRHLNLITWLSTSSLSATVVIQGVTFFDVSISGL